MENNDKLNEIEIKIVELKQLMNNIDENIRKNSNKIIPDDRLKETIESMKVIQKKVDDLLSNTDEKIKTLTNRVDEIEKLIKNTINNIGDEINKLKEQMNNIPKGKSSGAKENVKKVPGSKEKRKGIIAVIKTGFRNIFGGKK